MEPRADGCPALLATVRNAFVKSQAQRLAARTGIEIERARQVVASQCRGVLLPDVLLPFDDLAEVTVGDVLGDPSRFEGETLADPLEGVDYGRCKARIMMRADGTPWIHSFAHGRTTFELRYDAGAVEAAISVAAKADAVGTFLRLVVMADLNPQELERLRNLVAAHSGTGVRTLDRMIKQAQQARVTQNARDASERRMAERLDPRPPVPAPPVDAPWLPQMNLLNEALGGANEPEPPARDMDGFMVQVRTRRAEKRHTLTAAGTNQEENAESRLPAPEQPLLTRLGEVELAELIERHIEYVDREGRSVHLASPFVRHFLNRSDDVLPVVSAVATLPVVLPNGEVLSGRGLNKERGIVFRVPVELMALLPEPTACDGKAVAAAMRFLTDDWLCDVAAGYEGRCIIVALLMSIIERLTLPERPAWNITAGQRGGGKTTTMNMIAMAALGRRAPAAAWSPSAEERRKALLAYLSEGVPFLVWDNIPLGETISCPSIEKALTAEMYSDRVLGLSEQRTVSAATIQAFTGNNIAAMGDLASRTLNVRLEVDRLDV